MSDPPSRIRYRSSSGQWRNVFTAALEREVSAGELTETSLIQASLSEEPAPACDHALTARFFAQSEPPAVAPTAEKSDDATAQADPERQEAQAAQDAAKPNLVENTVESADKSVHPAIPHTPPPEPKPAAQPKPGSAAANSKPAASSPPEPRPETSANRAPSAKSIGAPSRKPAPSNPGDPAAPRSGSPRTPNKRGNNNTAWWWVAGIVGVCLVAIWLGLWEDQTPPPTRSETNTANVSGAGARTNQSTPSPSPESRAPDSQRRPTDATTVSSNEAENPPARPDQPDRSDADRREPDTEAERQPAKPDPEPEAAQEPEVPPPPPPIVRTPVFAVRASAIYEAPSTSAQVVMRVERAAPALRVNAEGTPDGWIALAARAGVLYASSNAFADEAPPLLDGAPLRQFTVARDVIVSTPTGPRAMETIPAGSTVTITGALAADPDRVELILANGRIAYGAASHFETVTKPITEPVASVVRNPDFSRALDQRDFERARPRGRSPANVSANVTVRCWAVARSRYAQVESCRAETNSARASDRSYFAEWAVALAQRSELELLQADGPINGREVEFAFTFRLD